MGRLVGRADAGPKVAIGLALSLLSFVGVPCGASIGRDAERAALRVRFIQVIAQQWTVLFFVGIFM